MAEVSSEVSHPINSGADGPTVLVDGLSINGLSIHDEQQTNGHVNGTGVGSPATSSTSSASVASPPGQSPPQPPTYDDIFPALGGGDAGAASAAPTAGGIFSASARVVGGIRPPPRVRTSKVQTIYHVAPEERRRNSLARNEHDALNKIASDIMAKTDTQIQISSSRDGKLSFLISGKQESADKARRLIANEFQAQITTSLPVPREHHRIILGKAGRKLTELEQSTCTRIQIPKINEEGQQAELIRITGTKEAIDRAVREIRLISNDAASRCSDRLTVPKHFFPFIFGPFGETLEKIQTDTGAKVHIPPTYVNKDEISITGERNAVRAAKEAVLEIVKRIENYQIVAIELPKPKHKYLVGPKGNTLNEILRNTGVSVEMPPPDSNSTTITLRGEGGELGKALTVVMAKAHSETEEEMHVPGWIQRHILGPKGLKFQELRQQFPSVNVSFEIEEGVTRMTGPVADVALAKSLLQQRANLIASELAIEQIAVADPNHIKFIVGKNGSNLKQIRDETKATIQVITDQDSGVGSSDGSKRSSAASSPAHSANLGAQFVRIEGSKESVASAKQQLMQLLNRLENEVTHELIIDRRFYGQIIGPKGENIRDIRAKFNQVNITFPEANGSSDKVVIRGAKKDAELCHKYLTNLSKELLNSNYRLEVPIFSQLLQFLQRKDSIKKIREETGVRIDLPLVGSGVANTDVIAITGQKEKVEQARAKLTTVMNSMSDIQNVDILIPSKIHNYMLGAKGRNIKSIQSECGGVMINFPPEGSGSDKVQIMGPKDAVQKAKHLLVDMSNDYQTNNYSEELKVKVEHHRYLIGRGGANVNKLRDEFNVRLYFASDSGRGNSNGAAGEHADEERVTITGKKECVQKARTYLETKIKELDKIVEDIVHVDTKWHSLFLERRAALCKQIYDEYGGVNVSFPPQDKNDDRVSLKGSKECVQQAKQRILDIVANHEAQVAIDVHIDSQHHRQFLSRGAQVVNQIQHDFDVKIKFPARPRVNGGDEQQQQQQQQQQQEENELATVDDRLNIVTITGLKDNCEKAKEALLLLVPITETVTIPYEFHRFIIGQRGGEVRKLMDKFQVHVRVPQSDERSDLILVTGTKENVANARDELLEKLTKFEEEKADRELRSFTVTLSVDPQYHPKIIGKAGSVISKLRQKYGVQIQVPESGRAKNADEDGDPEVIIIQGYEANANDAKEAILALVKDLESQVSREISIDHRIHSRLIGSRGKNIKQMMDKFKVEIRFPRNGDSNPDLIVVSGAEDNVDECCEHLYELAEEFLDDIEVQYQPPAGFQINFEDLSTTAVVKEPTKGFQVRGGPWEKENSGGNETAKSNGGRLDTDNAQEFPAFGGSAENAGFNGGSAWGPRR